MKNHRIHFAALLALLLVALAAAKASAPKAIAWIADRRVEEPDIRRAALVLAQDPLRTKNHAAWRKELLDLCVDRELLALEAERSGFLKQEDVRRRIDRLRADYLYGEVRDRFLIPALRPTATQIDTARAGGLFRRAKIAVILTLTGKEALYEVTQALKHGARFDSVAQVFSIHPSAAHGGEIGWKFVGALNASSWREFQNAKPGDIMGPYVNADSHELYRVESIEEPTDQVIREAMMHDRMLEMESRYKVGLLQKNHFRLNPDAVSAAIFASATEPVDSILSSLDENGHRPKRDVHPSLGTIATVDGDSLDYRDLAASLVSRGPDGKAKMEDSRALLSQCTAAVLPRLIERDAHERSIDRDPVVVRRLRLIGEEVSTRAMVAHAVPPPDSAAVVAYVQAHASRYRKSAGHRAFVAMFADEDTARAALARWDRKAARDSFFVLGGFDPMPHATARNLFYRHYGEAVFYDDDQDPLSVAVRSLAEGQISPLIPTPNGYAIAQATGSEPARDATLDEARISAWIEVRETAENAWVTSQLKHLRTATPARTAPALLNAVRLGTVPETGGNRR